MEQQEKKCILQVKNLHVHYITDEEEVFAVNGISFDLNEGDSIGLVGETGAGKTTMAMAIMQLVPDPPGVITEGEIYFKGQNLILNTDKENEKIRGNGISMIFQDPMTALNPTMTIGDQLIEVLRRHNKMSKEEARKRCIEVLEMVGVKAERFNEAAGGDHHGSSVQPGPADCRRAHHGPGRDHPGPGAGYYAESEGKVPDGADYDYP